MHRKIHLTIYQKANRPNVMLNIRKISLKGYTKLCINLDYRSLKDIAPKQRSE